MIGNMVKKFKSILLVDDCPDDRFLARKILEKEGVNISEASGWRQAMERLKEEEVELIILDLVMPEMDGISLLKLIRERLKDIPVVIYTASTKYSAEDCLKRGSDAHVNKYSDPSILIKKIQELFRLKKAA